MLRLLSDENFNGDIVRGLLRRLPALDLVRVQDVGLMHASDAEILEWAATADRILLTHDVSTIPPAVAQRIAEAKKMPGAFLVPCQMPIGQVIEELQFLCVETEPSEWNNRILYLPI
jgi:hypothetical protein